VDGFCKGQLFAAAGVGTGVGVCVGVGFFFAAATAGDALGRGDGDGALAVGALGRGGEVPGSGVMMLTGGVEAAEGKSALVGLPVAPGDSTATGAGAGAGAAAGAFQEGA
jgi:hypothetical protein